MSNKKPRLGPTGIDKYIDIVWNFYSGCRHKEQGQCPPVPCWAENFVMRFKNLYPNGFQPTFYPDAFIAPLFLSKHKSYRIGVCFMGDLFGDWVNPSDEISNKNCTLQNAIFSVIRQCPQHTFIFLTKNPAGMRKWGKFPTNCEVGYSAWDEASFMNGLAQISNIDAPVHWCSLEPLLGWSENFLGNAMGLLDWIALGALTGTKQKMLKLESQYFALSPWTLDYKEKRWGLMPPDSWLENIVRQCDAVGTKVFIKNNLFTWLNELPLGEQHDLFFEEIGKLRQECGRKQKQEA